MAAPLPPAWGTCGFCGEAYPPDAKVCPTCGGKEEVRAGAQSSLPPRKRQKFRLIQFMRVLLIVAVIGGLAYATWSSGFSPPVVADPLTTSGWHTVGPGNYTYLDGPVTGEDYIVGNYSVMNPPGAPLTLEVYNSTDFTFYTAHVGAQPLLEQNGSTGRIVFSAPYTDTFYFVFVNPFAPTTQINLQVYIVTQYESNVVIE
jgi:hypothetical protein